MKRQSESPRPGLLESAPNVRLNTALYRFWNRTSLPLRVACAAVAGYYFITRTALPLAGKPLPPRITNRNP